MYNFWWSHNIVLILDFNSCNYILFTYDIPKHSQKLHLSVCIHFIWIIPDCFLIIRMIFNVNNDILQRRLLFWYFIVLRQLFLLESSAYFLKSEENWILKGRWVRFAYVTYKVYTYTYEHNGMYYLHVHIYS